jgi:hypothetical protein
MMNEQPEQDAQRQMVWQELQLDERLSSFYGPLLKEQPLAQTTWTDMQRKLGPQPRARNRQAWKHLLRRRKRQPIPEYIRGAYMHITYAARMSHPLPALQCAFKPEAVPDVHVPVRLKPSIHVTLPSAVTEIDGAILDTLLATGLARHKLSVHWSSLCVQILCLCPAVLSMFLLYFCKGLYLIPAVALILSFFLLSWLLMRRLKRHLCLSADALAVLWLGRERICRGLHGLAGHQRVTRHGRLRRRVRMSRVSGWSLPSLEERIEHVCGVQSTVYDERLTLVR